MTEQRAPQQSSDRQSSDRQSSDHRQPDHRHPDTRQARPPQGLPYRRLTRTSWDAPLSGVCGGIARYLGVDPTVVRVLAVVATLVAFPAGAIAYAVMWAVIPKEQAPLGV